MGKLRVLCCTIALAGCIVMPAVAQAPAFDVRTGLWEMTSERSSTGMPQMPAAPRIPPEVLAAMPPEQRARLRAAMQAAGQPSKRSRVKKVCITKKSLERGILDSGFPGSCTHTMRSRTRQAWEMQVICREQGRQQTMNFRYEAPTRDTINGKVDIVMTDGSRRMTMNQTMHGRWIGRDCGRVKPVDQ